MSVANTNDEREKMYIISVMVLHPTELVTSNFELMVSFAKETKGESYESRLEKLKELRGYYKAWDGWLQLIYSLESLHSGEEYDDRFITRKLVERADEHIEKKWNER